VSKAERRSAARLAASQALYQMEVGGSGLADILAEFEAHWIGQEVEGDQYNPAETAFFRDVVSGVLRDQVAIDRGVDDALAAGWPLKRVEALMRAILRAAFYELRSRPDVPARVVIKEYVDVAGAFFGAEESGMINAVLDALARQTRRSEFASESAP
jgi:N utilization substance protein B